MLQIEQIERKKVEAR